MPLLTHAVVWKGGKPKGKDAGESKDGKKSASSGKSLAILSWDEFMAVGNAKSEAEVAARVSALKPEQCCTLMYSIMILLSLKRKQLHFPRRIAFENDLSVYIQSHTHAHTRARAHTHN
jgi:hypothetical protein